MSESQIRLTQYTRAQPVGYVLNMLACLLAFIGGLVLVAMTLMSAYSIFMRTFFDEPLLGDVELVQMGCGVAIMCFLPLCQLRRGNVIVDVFTLNAPAALRNIMDALGGLLTAAAAGLLAWRSVIGALDAHGTGEESIILGLPLWWPMSVFGPAFALLVVVSLYTAWQDLRGGEHA
ncbi:TRAP-type C4-dicarboxylate transport system permease small subunit [Pseudomonas duriflava]|uniref:TRAP transporter small permease protein n=1 Tax=Pseudomonas duriflava TaxID=459528 RepID=A0A562Q9G2_9PSED|nr:TRAP transporter small permease [Pseudomonas duriflava]TWI52666.1 TRAP-type C4-dicarboxylate transport system permease small subunit [Pseudomonas duriflava]